jgi:hypothetical protein
VREAVAKGAITASRYQLFRELTEQSTVGVKRI